MVSYALGLFFAMTVSFLVGCIAQLETGIIEKEVEA